MKLVIVAFSLLLSLFPFLSNSYAAQTSQEIQKVNYDLPYPGILPDNPLYFVKAIRDNFLGLFITGPFKKADFDLLQADKRLASAKALLDKGNPVLSITTLSKSGNYFDKAIGFASSSKDQKIPDTNSLIDRMLLSSKKQQEVIYQMIQKEKGDDYKKTYGFYLKRAEDFQKRLEELRPR